MKKIGIITICDYTNYGNRLQNYASQEVLKSLGCKVETIVNIPYKSGVQNRLSKIINMSGKEFFERVNAKISKRLNEKNFDGCCSQRINAFKNFTNENIYETQFTISENKIPTNLSDEYDYFVVGSDQVWNPNFRHGSSLDFLTFAPKQKRIAYSPSFGISSIPDEHVENYSSWLSQMENLSVREEAGARIIKELTGRDTVVLVDPTLMLSKEKWLSVTKPSDHKPENAYLLTYFLGEVSKKYQNSIRKIALDNKLETVNLADLNDRVRYTVDPGEFIDYVNSATVFLTDSFHGAVFSILLEKPFIIFDRVGKITSMNSRIDTLLSTFNLGSRKWNNINNNADIFNVNYSHVAPILEFERNKALDYLKGALYLKEFDSEN